MIAELLLASSLSFGAPSLVAAAAASGRPPECHQPIGAASGLGPTVWRQALVPGLATYCDDLARAQVRLGQDPRAAQRAAEHAAKLLPGRAAPHVLLARAAVAQSQDAEALRQFETARALEPRSIEAPVALRDYAVVLWRVGRLDDALAAYRVLVPRAALLPTRAERARARQWAFLRPLRPGRYHYVVGFVPLPELRPAHQAVVEFELISAGDKLVERALGATVIRAAELSAFSHAAIRVDPQVLAAMVDMTTRSATRSGATPADSSRLQPTPAYASRWLLTTGRIYGSSTGPAKRCGQLLQASRLRRFSSARAPRATTTTRRPCSRDVVLAISLHSRLVPAVRSTYSTVARATHEACPRDTTAQVLPT